jgi:hypothetical protein
MRTMVENNDTYRNRDLPEKGIGATLAKNIQRFVKCRCSLPYLQKKPITDLFLEPIEPVPTHSHWSLNIYFLFLLLLLLLLFLLLPLAA